MKKVLEFLKYYFFEISTYRDLRKIIRKHQDTADWKRYNLRVDWVGRIYTVVNPNYPTDTGDSEQILDIKYAEKIKEVNDYLFALGLAFFYSLETQKIPGSQSVLVVWSPIHQYFTVWNTIKLVLGTLFGLFVLVKLILFFSSWSNLDFLNEIIFYYI